MTEPLSVKLDDAAAAALSAYQDCLRRERAASDTADAARLSASDTADAHEDAIAETRWARRDLDKHLLRLTSAPAVPQLIPAHLCRENEPALLDVLNARPSPPPLTVEDEVVGPVQTGAASWPVTEATWASSGEAVRVTRRVAEDSDISIVRDLAPDEP